MKPTRSLLLGALMLISTTTTAIGAPLTAPEKSADSLLAGIPTTPSETAATDYRYSFTTDYYNYDSTGKFQSKDRVLGRFTQSIRLGKDVWNAVTIAHAQAIDAVFGPGDPQAYMEGFSYPLGPGVDTFSPQFFRGFPDDMEPKTLVWDEGQIELFGTAYLKDLKLDTPYYPVLAEAHFPGGGSFHNTKAVITWIGVSKVDGKLCAQILYDSPMNPISLTVQNMNLHGLSSYHGLISIDLADLHVERGTIKEDVVMSIVMPNAPANYPPMVTHTIRDCVLQRL